MAPPTGGRVSVKGRGLWEATPTGSPAWGGGWSLYALHCGRSLYKPHPLTAHSGWGLCGVRPELQPQKKKELNVMAPHETGLEKQRRCKCKKPLQDLKTSRC